MSSRALSERRNGGVISCSIFISCSIPVVRCGGGGRSVGVRPVKITQGKNKTKQNEALCVIMGTRTFPYT